MAHLLNVAAQRNLRHLIVVLPYTNIIKQSVDVYRRSLVLDAEPAKEIVAEHHHQADFSGIDVRHLAALWKAPIIVTTAVQFIETLASHHPARIRKLHELPGTAVFIDETHAAGPSHLWPQLWRWLDTWTRDWGGHLVLASGSLPRFWELSDFVNPPKASNEVPDLLPDGLRSELETCETTRLKVRRVANALSGDDLIRLVQKQPGPRLVVVNTVQSAAVLADNMRQRGMDVLHLSTALAPAHRETIVQNIKHRLREQTKVSDWTLVATSCVEAGMDFSFGVGFRETCSTASLIQIGGRVNRECEFGASFIWHFRISDENLPQHPGFQVPQRVLESLLSDGAFERCAPSELAKEAMRREMTEGARIRADGIGEAESQMEYPLVDRLCRVIDSDTRLVIIDRLLAERVRNYERVRTTELIRLSVQMRTSRIEDYGLEPIGPDAELFAWTAAYDPEFLGYMAGVMPLIQGSRDAIYLV
jgi:CRISPR-associated endonuclease/helicase Cas3